MLQFCDVFPTMVQRKISFKQVLGLFPPFLMYLFIHQLQILIFEVALFSNKLKFKTSDWMYNCWEYSKLRWFGFWNEVSLFQIIFRSWRSCVRILYLLLLQDSGNSFLGRWYSLGNLWCIWSKPPELRLLGKDTASPTQVVQAGGKRQFFLGQSKPQDPKGQGMRRRIMDRNNI